MTDILERMKWWGAKRRPPRNMPTLPSDCAEAADEIERLRKALQPFAKAGKVIDGPFGPALFAEDDTAFQSGCAWSENGERRTITWGDFRRACAALDAVNGGRG